VLTSLREIVKLSSHRVGAVRQGVTLVLKKQLMVIAFCFLSIGQGAIADSSQSDINFFKAPIDYWGEKKSQKPEKSKPEIVKDNKEESKRESETFSWKQHLDPNNKEFFREGTHMPPEPFIELVRNPNDENIRNWFKYIELKNKLAQRLQERLAEYAKEQQGTLSDKERNLLARKIDNVPKARLDIKRYRFRLYVDSGCPYCKKMLGTMADLSSQGFFVEVHQIDANSEKLRGSPVVVTKANPTDVKRHNITAVPLLLIGDMKSNTVFRLNGFQTVQSIFASLRT